MAPSAKGWEGRATEKASPAAGKGLEKGWEMRRMATATLWISVD